jgi:hypothetical protein
MGHIIKYFLAKLLNSFVLSKLFLVQAARAIIINFAKGRSAKGGGNFGKV